MTIYPTGPGRTLPARTPHPGITACNHEETL